MASNAVPFVARAISERPASAVSHGVGLSGLAGLFAWIAIARTYGMSGPLAALVAVGACAVPMVAWSLMIDKVHRNASTGIAWDATPHALARTLDISLAKLAGLWATWALIACVYALGRFYWSGPYVFAMNVFVVATPILFAASVPYVLWIDTRLRHPRDGAWALGMWLMGNAPADRHAIGDHLRAWAVKGFFLAFMLSIVPGNFADVVARRWEDMVASPVALANALIALMFLIDVAIATVGYVLTLKPLDSHIRSANPHADGWVAALICYPPFILMTTGGPLDYHPGTMDWTYWLGGGEALVVLWCVLLVALTAIYAWATVAFGIRFSNLTHRGIVTHGPYAWTRHPAYLSKNAFWWLSTLPFLTTSGGWVGAVRNTAILAIVSGVYWWRAKTEERHLSSDPVYRDYVRWIRSRRTRCLP